MDNSRLCVEKESSVERYFVKLCEEQGWECLKLVSPGHRGMPDRMVVARFGVVAFCELKRPSGGKVSGLQIYWISKFRARGFIAGVVKNRKEAIDMVWAIQDLVVRKSKEGI